MVSYKSRKIIITGTGRTGTTFLVELLTELGLDTGYASSSLQPDYDENAHAGLEQDVEAPASPYIVKNPALCTELPAVLARGHVRIDYALIPIRNLDDATQSRVRIGGNGHRAGGLVGTKKPEQQKAVLAENFHTLVETLAAHDIPHTFLHFPRFACDADYTFEKLQPLLGTTARTHFDTCFARVARPELIHSFQPGDASPAPPPPRKKNTLTRGRRLERNALRAAAALAIFGLGWLTQRQSEPADQTPATATIATPAATAIRSDPLAPPVFLPSFRSPPFRVRDSLSLASLDISSERSFPSEFGPVHLLNRPRRPPLFFRGEMPLPLREMVH